jgi:hypothetical protein
MDTRGGPGERPRIIEEISRLAVASKRPRCGRWAEVFFLLVEGERSRWRRGIVRVKMGGLKAITSCQCSRAGWNVRIQSAGAGPDWQDQNQLSRSTTTRIAYLPRKQARNQGQDFPYPSQSQNQTQHNASATGSSAIKPIQYVQTPGNKARNSSNYLSNSNQ